MNPSLSKEAIAAELKEMTGRMGKCRETLLPILTELNDRHGYLSEDACIAVAEELDISPSEVFSVASFYSFFSTSPRGKHIIRLCSTITCDLAGKDEVEQALRESLKIGFGETTDDGRFTLEHTQCVGLCDQGPALLVNDDVYTRVSADKVAEILGKY